MIQTLLQKLINGELTLQETEDAILKELVHPLDTNWGTGNSYARGGGGGTTSITWLPQTPPETETLDPETVAWAQERISKGETCMHCGGLHLRACPRVKRIIWASNRELHEVEYWPTWSHENIVWPEELTPQGSEEESAG